MCLVSLVNMKNRFLYFIILFFSLFAFRSFSQISEADNPIILVAYGSADTKEDAHLDALESCISLAISGLNSSGLDPVIPFETQQNLVLNASTFLDYSVLYDDQLPNGKIVSLLKVRINAYKLEYVLKAANINVVFKGGNLANQIKQQILNEQSEIAALKNMVELLDEPMLSVFDYKIKSGFPKSLDDTNKEWAIPINVQVFTNKQIDYCSKLFFHTLSELSIEPEELSLYERMNKKVFPININYQGNQFNFLLRKQISINIISGFINNWESYLLNFKINEGKNEYVGTDAIFLENTSYNSSISTTNESIVNAKKGYQFALNKNSLDIDLQFPKAFQLVGEYSWNDVKNLSQLESIEDYTIQSSGDKIYREIKEKSINEKSEDEIFTAVEQQAEFPGGPGAWRRYLIKSLKYPSAARRANVGGRVFVSFVVNTDGSVSDIQILKGVGFGCDEEAIRLIKSMPRWNPGKQSGRAVRSRFTQPITFVANDEESDN